MYAHWWEDRQQWMAEIISFTPGDAEPLDYHDGHMVVTPPFDQPTA